MPLPIHAFGHDFLLHPDKVLIHSESATLFIADAHFGKSGTFRLGGIPVPEGVLDQDLDRLASLINQFSIKEVYFLGDLFHSDVNNEWNAFSNWRRTYPHIKMNLIEGNHDILQKELYHQATIEVFPEPCPWNGILLRHHPPKYKKGTSEPPSLCGHIHPGVRVSDAGKFKETLPCFHQTPQMLMLPAFGAFTGLASITPKSQDIVYVIAGSLVQEFRHPAE